MPKFVVIRKYVVNIPPPGEARDALVHEVATNVPQDEMSDNTTETVLTYLVESSVVGDHTDKVALVRQTWATMRSDDQDWSAV